MSFPAGSYVRSDRWRLAGSSVGLTEGLAARPNYGAGQRPIWVADFTVRVPTLGTDAALFAWNAWAARRRGPARAYAMTPGLGLRDVVSGVDWQYTERYTLDGKQRVTQDGAIRVIAVAPRFSGAAAEGDSRIAVRDETLVTRGRLIWIAGTMYRVTRVDAPYLEIEPPLRAAAPANTAIAASGTVSMILDDSESAVAQRVPQGFVDLTFSMREAV